MDRATRDKFATRTQADLTSGNACWETPPAIFAKLHDEFAFDLDLTADARRALRPQWFGPGGLLPDALTADWSSWGSGYANPPYGPFVGRILDKACRARAVGFTSVFLLPLRITKAFRASVMRGAAEVRLCDRRITFWEHGAPRVSRDKSGIWKADPAMFDSVIVVYRPGHDAGRPPQLLEWGVPDHVSPDDVARAVGRKT